MKNRPLLFAALACALLALALPAASAACPVCYGEADSSSTQAMNAAILSLLGVTGGVLGGFVSMFLHVRRRAKAITRDESRA
jgi:hypothetical protein